MKVGFTRLKPDMITSYDIIGEINANTGAKTGLELVNTVFPKFRIVSGLLGSPKWSTKPEVAVAMRAKAENVNGLFTDWKNRNNYIGTHEIACWSMAKLGDDVYHMSLRNCEQQNWIGGWRALGNTYHVNTDVKDMFIPVRRMFDWIGNEFILFKRPCSTG